MTFRAGQSGNPTGARKTKEMREALRIVLKDFEKGLLDKPRNNMDAIVRAHVSKALEGDMAAIKEIYDRIDGKVPQGVVGGDEGDRPISLVTRIELVGLAAKQD